MEQSVCEGVRFERGGRIAIVEFTEQTMNRRFVGWLASALDCIDKAEACRAIVFTGRRRMFMTGADFAELAQLQTSQDVDNFLCLPHRLMLRIADSARLTVAAINGYCLGGGLELAAVCHYRVAVSDLLGRNGLEAEILGVPEVRLGLVPALGGVYSLHRVIGGRALRLLATGLPITASEASRIGLVDFVAPSCGVLPRSLEFCDSVVQNPEGAMSSLNRLLGSERPSFGFAGALDRARAEFASCCLRPDKNLRLESARKELAATFGRLTQAASGVGANDAKAGALC